MKIDCDDFRFTGPFGSDGAKIEKIKENHFKVALGHAPEHPTWCNMLQFEICRHAKGNRLQLEVLAEVNAFLEQMEQYYQAVAVQREYAPLWEVLWPLGDHLATFHSFGR